MIAPRTSQYNKIVNGAKKALLKSKRNKDQPESQHQQQNKQNKPPAVPPRPSIRDKRDAPYLKATSQNIQTSSFVVQQQQQQQQEEDSDDHKLYVVPNMRNGGNKNKQPPQDLYADFGLPTNNNDLVVPKLIRTTPEPLIHGSPTDRVAMPRGSSISQDSSLRSSRGSNGSDSSRTSSPLKLMSTRPLPNAPHGSDDNDNGQDAIFELSRDQAEDCLKDYGMISGDFLFRVSHGAVVLSVSDGMRIHHLVVEGKSDSTVDTQYFDQRRLQRFVNFYKQDNDGVLPTPLQRHVKPSRPS